MAAIVYLATNRINGKRYVGATGKTMAMRRSQHEQAPNAKRVTCRYFHAAMRKYGPESFDWKVLASCETFEVALQEEIRLIAEIGPEYNLTPGGQGNSAKRGPMTAEQRAIRRVKMGGYGVSTETRAKISAFHRGRKRDPEVCRKISAAKTGKKFSAEHCRNIGFARKGQKSTPEAIEARAAAHRGKPLSDEHKESIRQALKGRKRPAAVVARMLATRAQTFAVRRMEVARG